MSMELMRAPLKLASAARDSTTEHSSARASHTIKHVLANEYARVRAAKRRGAVVGAGGREHGLGELRPVHRAGDERNSAANELATQAFLFARGDDAPGASALGELDLSGAHQRSPP